MSVLVVIETPLTTLPRQACTLPASDSHYHQRYHARRPTDVTPSNGIHKRTLIPSLSLLIIKMAAPYIRSTIIGLWSVLDIGRHLANFHQARRALCRVSNYEHDPIVTGVKRASVAPIVQELL